MKRLNIVNILILPKLIKFKTKRKGIIDIVGNLGKIGIV